MKDVTLDSISMRGAGVVTIAQPSKGFRFTLDSILLADFSRIKPRDRILEPGTGTGVISILLARKFPSVKITGVEVQSDSADLCRWNVHANDLQDRIAVIVRDIKTLKKQFTSGSFDMLIANPPYTKGGSGRRSPRSSRQTARHDASGDIRAWLDLQIFLKNKGRFYTIFAADRTAELLSLLRNRKLEPKRLRFVHAYASEPASLVLIEAVKSAGTGLEVLAPLVVHEPGGGYSEEMREIYGP
jgi:tRNA1(Val) A37 N6-methylase TrmN6